MLDLSGLEAERAVLVLAGQLERVEEATWVAALLRVGLRVAVDLSTANQDNLNPDQLGDGERQRKAGVRSAVQLNLAGLNPANTTREDREVKNEYCSI